MHPLRKQITGVTPASEGPALASKDKDGGPLEGSLKRLSIRRSERRQVHQRNEDRFFISDHEAVGRWRGRQSKLRILNISSNGVMVETPRRADIGERVRLQLADCNPITCSVRWACDGRVGLEFSDETEILDETGVRDYLIETISAALGGPSSVSGRRVGRERRGREMRHGLVWAGVVSIGPQTYTARLRNISTSGAMVALDEPVANVVGEKIKLDLEAAGIAKGLIRWASEFELGIEFSSPFDLTKLAYEPPLPPSEAALEQARREGRGGHLVNRYTRPREDFNPHQPPEMDYHRLTLDDIYATLYPNGRPEPAPAPDEDEG